NKNVSIMKNLKLLMIFLITVSMVSCADAQTWNRVTGNGNVQTEERKASPFTGIKTSSGIDVFLSQGNGHSIVVEADENLIEYIVTEIDNGILRVYPDNISIRGTRTMRVYVTMENVEYLHTSSAGDIIGETPVRTEKLKISTSSSGDVKLEVYASELLLKTSSAGDITLKGTADYVEASTSSAGDIKAYDLEVREADLSASSAGDIKITVTERMRARASSAGDIHYQGNPQFVDARSSSGGDVTRK
ncbi:MAG: head GIN domain-containing protein, partial [Bacteroidales bacterium]|nr:head GIN domain-containing protein [Bacteroidales bacterium]